MTEENEQRMERLFHDHYEQMYRFAFALLHDNEEPRTKLTHGGFQTQVQGTLLSDIGMVSDLLKQIPRVRVNADGGCSIFSRTSEAL